MAAAPSDPQPRLRYAGLLFAAGDSAAALGKLDEAINLLGGQAKMSPGPNRDQVFSDALTFAEKLTATGNAERAAAGHGAVRPAAAAAESPASSALPPEPREAGRGRRDAATSVRLYQEILSDPKMRTESLTDTAPADAGRRVRGEGDQQPDAPGRRERLRAVPAGRQRSAGRAQLARDPNKLLAVAQVYPNSTVAPEAMLAAGDAYEAAGDAKAAVNVLRPMYFKFPDSKEKPRIIESMARNYLLLKNRRGNVDSAAARLAQGTSLTGNPVLTPAHAARRQATRRRDVLLAGAGRGAQVHRPRGRQGAARLPPPAPAHADEGGEAGQPVLALAPPKPQDTTINDVTTLVLAVRDFSRPDRLVTWTAGRGLSIFPAATNKPLGSSDSVTQPPSRLAWVDEDLLVWGSTEVVLVPGAGGRAKWKLDVRTLPPVEVMHLADAAGPGAAGGFPNAPFGNAMVVGPGNRQFVFRNGMMQPIAVPALPPRRRPPVRRKRSPKSAPSATESWSRRPPAGSSPPSGPPARRWAGAAERPHPRPRGGHRGLRRRPHKRRQHRAARRARHLHRPAPGHQAVPRSAGRRADELDPVGRRHAGLHAAQRTGAEGPLQAVGRPGSEKAIQGPAQQPPYTGAMRPTSSSSPRAAPALADGGPQIGVTPDKYVRLHSLETGLALPLKFKTGKGDEEVDRVLTTGNKSWDVGLRVIGPYLVRDRAGRHCQLQPRPPQRELDD